MNRIIKSTLTIAAVLAVCLMGLTGCMTTDDRAMSTEQPSPQPTAQPLTNGAGAVGANPDASMSPSVDQQPSTRPAYDWTANAEQAAAELNRISEISQSCIVVNGDKAIVGVEFDASYRGGLTERITNMVRQKLVTLDTALTDVQVTAEPDQVQRIQALAEKLAGGATMEQLSGEFDTIYGQIQSAGTGKA